MTYFVSDCLHILNINASNANLHNGFKCSEVTQRIR